MPRNRDAGMTSENREFPLFPAHLRGLDIMDIRVIQNKKVVSNQIGVPNLLKLGVNRDV